MATPATVRQGASSEAIQFHYDLGNDFYRLWLDPTLCYSAALWGEGDDLEAAQIRKLDWHIEHSGARGTERVLDVGCGWGAIVQRLVGQAGVRQAVGLTLSAAQAGYISGLGVPGVEVRLESWVDHAPSAAYDAIISIGAFEHFARIESSDSERVEAYRAFFTRCRDWLRPRGRLSLQTFAYGGLRPRASVQQTAGTRFLAASIFPETDPPRLAEIATACDRLFEVVLLRNDRRDYARTCREWLRRLRAQRAAVVELVGEESFQRYERYLALSQLGFETGDLALYRIALQRLEGR